MIRKKLTLFEAKKFLKSKGFFLNLKKNNQKKNLRLENLGPFSTFIRELSKNFPIQYGIISIIFAILLGVAAAFIRRFFSDLRKKHFKKA